MGYVVRAKVTQGGRIVIPAEMSRRLGIETGDDVSVAVDNGSLRKRTQKESIKRAQALVRKFVTEGVSLVDELIAERRREAADE